MDQYRLFIAYVRYLYFYVALFMLPKSHSMYTKYIHSILLLFLHSMFARVRIVSAVYIPSVPMGISCTDCSSSPSMPVCLVGKVRQVNVRYQDCLICLLKTNV